MVSTGSYSLTPAERRRIRLQGDLEQAKKDVAERESEEEAARNGKPDPASDPFARMIANLDAQAVDGNDVGNLPAAKIIVPELGITEKSTVEIFGRMKSGKTFLAGDLACSLAAGADWRGHPLRARRVLYLIGEGTPGLGSRIRAWKFHRGIDDLQHLIFQPTKLTLNRDDDFTALLGWVKARGPFGAVFVDTLARYSSGADENGSQMQVVVDRAEAIRDACTSEGPLVIVHHSGRGNNDHGRGHTSVESACDLIVRTSKDGNKVQAEVLDNRHAPPGTVMRWTLDPMPEAREFGEDHDPAVLVPDLATTDTFLPESRRAVLDALETIVAGGEEWVSSGKWHDVADMPATTFHRAKKDLVVREWVEVDESGRYPRFRPAQNKGDLPSEQGF